MVYNSYFVFPDLHWESVFSQWALVHFMKMVLEHGIKSKPTSAGMLTTTELSIAFLGLYSGQN